VEAAGGGAGGVGAGGGAGSCVSRAWGGLDGSAGGTGRAAAGQAQPTIAAAAVTVSQILIRVMGWPA
jgi:hypothetical protein